MARRGRPTATPVLSDEERETLERWAPRPNSAQALALRCRIVLACAEGATNQEVAAGWGCIRRRWVSGVVGLWPVGSMVCMTSLARGAPRKISDEHVERVIVKTLEETPADATHWSTRSMAKASGLNQTAVSRIWRAFGLKPHLAESFKLSPDPQFIDKVRDIVGLYLNPPDAAVVLCVDEKSQIQALDRTAPVLALLAGVPERRTHDYVRSGTTNLYAALDVASGNVIADLTPRHRAHEFIRFLNLINRSVPANLDIHVIVELLDPQDPRRAPLAGPSPPLHAALHAHLQLVAQPRRTLVRRTHDQVAATRHPPLGQRTSRRHPHLDHQLERPAGGPIPGPGCART